MSQYKKDNKATVVLGHKIRTYRGEEKESFTGKLTINKKDYLLTISAQEGSPVIYESSKDQTPIFYLNVISLGNKTDRKRRNEL